MEKGDSWTSGGAYEPYVGRWSRLVAAEFLSWLSLPAGGRWLDAGCGTGALSSTILQRAQPAAVVGIDPARNFVAHARANIADPRAAFFAGNALSLPFRDGTFAAIVSGLALNFMPSPEKALAEMVRIVRRNGIVAAYVWDYAGQMQMLRTFWDAAIELDPAVAEQDEGPRFPLCRPAPLAEHFQNAGLAGVAVRAIDITTRFRNFDDYWQPFLGGQGPAPSYVASLDEGRRATLRERIRSMLPMDPDGSISLIARAWAVQGRN